MDDAIVTRLVDAARYAPSADNSQPFHIDWDGEALSIRYDATRVAGLTFPPHNPATLLSIGALLENLVTLADQWLLEPTLELNLDSEQSGTAALPYARLRFQGSGIEIDDTRAGAVTERHTDRGTFHARAIPDEIVTTIANASRGSARAWVTQDTEERRRVAQLIDMASRVRFCTREVHEWLGRSLRFGEKEVKRGDGLDVATLALPPGGTAILRLIADWRRLRILNKLGMYRLLAAIDARPVRRGPCLVSIVANDTSQGAVDAGRLLTSLWTDLNQKGLAVHPYYVVADQIARLRSNDVPEAWRATTAAIADESHELFGVREHETLYMLLRIGYSKKPVKRSLRLPLAAVYSDRSDMQDKCAPS